MRVCIPTNDDTGRSAIVHGHFGSAPCFTIADTDTGSLSTLVNTNAHHAHGTCHPLGQLTGQDIGAIVVGGIGHRALEALRAGGLAVYRADAGATVADILDRLAAGDLREIDAVHACAGHGHGTMSAKGFNVAFASGRGRHGHDHQHHDHDHDHDHCSGAGRGQGRGGGRGQGRGAGRGGRGR
jgi:predicted Fe-Mo cluster-binding NifX family protein